MAHQQSSRGHCTSIILNHRKVVRFFYVCVAIFTLINLGIVYLRYTRFSDTEFEAILTRFLGTDSEANVPTYYSSLALLISSGLASAIGLCIRAAQGKGSGHWFGLGLLFLLMSADEICSIHEFINDEIPVLLSALGIQLPGWLVWPWILLGGVFVILMVSIYIPFLRTLPGRTRNMFILAGTIFVAGAVGMELVGGVVRNAYGFSLAIYLCYSLEECLEMLGVAIFIQSLIEYLTTQFPAIQVVPASQPMPASQHAEDDMITSATIPSERRHLT